MELKTDVHEALVALSTDQALRNQFFIELANSYPEILTGVFRTVLPSNPVYVAGAEVSAMIGRIKLGLRQGTMTAVDAVKLLREDIHTKTGQVVKINDILPTVKALPEYEIDRQRRWH